MLSAVLSVDSRCAIKIVVRDCVALIFEMAVLTSDSDMGRINNAVTVDSRINQLTRSSVKGGSRSANRSHISDQEDLPQQGDTHSSQTRMAGRWSNALAIASR